MKKRSAQQRFFLGLRISQAIDSEGILVRRLGRTHLQTPPRPGLTLGSMCKEAIFYRSWWWSPLKPGSEQES